MTEKTKADELASRIAEYLADKLGDALGYQDRFDMDWSDEDNDEDGMFPWTVVDSTGRKFEIEFDVSVSELTEQVQAERAKLMEMLATYQAAVETPEV